MLLLRLLFDFGLVVLIWLVQLVIYPGFSYFSPANLQQWHKIYTTRIAIVVIPLMIGQLLVAAFQLYFEQNIYTAGSLLLISINWLLTFSIYVPLHKKITNNLSDKNSITKLIHKNWFRTILWTLIFIWSLFYYSTL